MASSANGASDRSARLVVIILLFAAALIVAAIYSRLHPRLEVDQSAHAPVESAPDDVTPIGHISTRARRGQLEVLNTSRRDGEVS